MNTKNNRKARLTKQIFHETLIDLLLENHISEISIKKLCEAADLNRSTFYSHYENQIELLKEVEDEVYAEVSNLIMSGVHPNQKTDSVLIFEKLLSYIKLNQKVFLVLLGQNGSEDFSQKLMELTQQAHDVRGINPAILSKWELTYVRIYRVTGCAKVIENWLQEGCKQSVEEMAKLLITLSAE